MIFFEILGLCFALSPLFFYALGRWHWFFELGTHYLPYGFFASLILLPFHPWILPLYLLCFLKLYPALTRLSPSTQAQRPTQRIFFQNLYYKNRYDEKDLKKLVEWDAEIIALIESQENLCAPQGYPYEYRNSQKGPQGLCLWSKKALQVSEHCFGTFSTLQIQEPHVDIWVIHPLPCLKASWAKNYEIFFEELGKNLSPNKAWMILGDFNGSYWDRTLSLFAKKSGGTWAKPWQKTWHARWPFVYLSIDHCLSSKLFVSKKSLRLASSDHRAILVDFHD